MQGESGEGRSTAGVRAAGAAVLLAVLAACGGGGGAGGSAGSGGVGGSGAASSLGTVEIPSSAAVTSASPSAAQLRPRDFTLNTTTAGDQGRAAVAALAGGGFVAVWSTSGASLASDVRLRRFDADGQPQGGEQVVSTSGHSAGVAALADGGFVVSWSASPFMYSADGQVQRYDAQGAPVGGPVQQVATFYKYVARPLGLRDGGYVMAADTTTGRFGSEHGQVTRYAADGAPVGAPVRLTSQLTAQTGGADPNRADGTIAARWPDGRFATAWIASGTGVAQVRLTRFDAQGAEAGTDVVATGGLLLQPSLVVLAGGGHALAWVEAAGTPDGAKTLWLETFGADGVSQGRQAVEQDVQATTLTPRLAALADGGIVLGWKAVNDDATSLHRTLRMQRFGATGLAVGAAETVSTASAPVDITAFEADTLDLLGMPDGGYLLVHGAYSADQGWDVRGSFRR